MTHAAGQKLLQNSDTPPGGTGKSEKLLRKLVGGHAVPSGAGPPDRCRCGRRAGRPHTDPKVIQTFDAPLDLATFRDEDVEGLQKVIEAKIAGREIVAPSMGELPPAGNVMEALRKSLEAVSQGRRRPPRCRRPERRPSDRERPDGDVEVAEPCSSPRGPQ